MEDLTKVPDRQLGDWLFWDDVRFTEMMEMDALAYIDEDEELQAAETARRAQREAIKAEIERRGELGLYIPEPGELTLEERWAPYGPEWQLEQRERAEGI